VESFPEDSQLVGKGRPDDTQLPNLSALREGLEGRLRLLTIVLSHAWGGLEQVAVQDTLDLAAAGLTARFVCYQGSPIHEHLTGKQGIELVSLEFSPRNFFDFKLRKLIHKELREGANVIHLHQTSLLGSIVPWVWRHPEVVLVASRHIMSDHRKTSFFHRILYSRVDQLLVMSDALKEHILNTHSIRESQVSVIRLGLDFERFNPSQVSGERLRAEWGADGGTTVIGMVGRIDPAKGQETFLKAAASLMKNPREGERLKFVIVGEETKGLDGTYLEELKKMVASFRMSDQVVFVGYQENVPEIMRAFDVFVMPSRQEAFGLVAIEAMAMECPIVISKGGSAREIVGDDEFGLTARAEDAYDLQRQLRRLIDGPVERLQMGQRARSHVVSLYDRRIRLLGTLDLYHRYLRRRSLLN
jgi:glycosyltransferase involved in cell wall biosynthesis